MNIENTAQDLFDKIRNEIQNIKLGDEEGKALSPDKIDQARIFNFEYMNKDSDKPYGAVLISIIDPRSMGIYYGLDMAKNMSPEDQKDWTNWLKEMRRFAKKHLMNFDVRDITRSNFTKRDLEFLKSKKPKESTVESVNESMLSPMNTRRMHSEQRIGECSLIIKHAFPLDDMSKLTRGAIDKIYIQNPSGERFLSPSKSLLASRLLAMHTNQGGNIYDPQGQGIIGVVDEANKLAKFLRMTRSSKYEGLNEEAAEMRQCAGMRLESLRRVLRSSLSERGYGRLMEFMESDKLINSDDEEDIKEYFTRNVYDEGLDETLPFVRKARKIAKEQIMSESAAVVRFVNDPNTMLVLRQDPASDELVKRTKGDPIALVTRILSDIASRSLGDEMDEVANFASEMAEKLPTEGQSFGQRPDAQYNKDKALAIKLAKKYIDDLARMKNDPEYASLVRVDPSEFKQRQKRSGPRKSGTRESMAFENWVMSEMGDMPKKAIMNDEEELDEVESLEDEVTGDTEENFSKRVSKKGVPESYMSEGPRSFLADPDKVEELNDMLKSQFKIGIEGIDAIEALSDILPDESLVDEIKNAYSKGGPDLSIGPVLYNWAIDNQSSIMDKLDFSDIDKTQNPYQSLTEPKEPEAAPATPPEIAPAAVAPAVPPEVPAEPTAAPEVPPEVPAEAPPEGEVPPETPPGEEELPGPPVAEDELKRIRKLSGL